MAGDRRSTIRRLLQLWRLHAAMDLTWMLRDIKAVLTFVASDMIVGTAAVTGTLLLAARFDGIGRWTTAQVVFMLGYAMLVTGLPGILFNYNVGFISRRLGRGQLDHTLVQPQPLWMSLLTEGFIPFTGSGLLIPGGLLVYLGGRDLGLAPGPVWLVLLALNLVGSVAVILGFNAAWATLAFWAPRSAEEINSSTYRMMNQLKEFPLDGMGPLLVGGLVTVLPVGLVAWYPARALIGLDGWIGAVAVTPLAG